MPLALELAAAGAEEGTLVYRSMTRANSNLDCALILQPDVAPARYFEYGFVAAVSVGQAIAASASPMVTLQYGWPDRVVLNDQTVARVSLTLPEASSMHSEAALVLGVQIFIGSPPKNLDDSTCLRVVDSENTTDATELMNLFGRHFLHWINTWDEEGFAKVLAAWSPRIDRTYGALTQIQTSAQEPTKTVTGIIDTVDENGALQLSSEDSSAMSLQPGDYFGVGS